MALAYSQEESSHCEMASRSSKGVKIYRGTVRVITGHCKESKVNGLLTIT